MDQVENRDIAVYILLTFIGINDQQSEKKA